ncbi:MAG TPA: His/Gly/Thr/Pro-type tRNA ligase C-terminal domain-containing protein, partial [Bacillota bacterium]|nr:His/Gly/Thr/Pro-type tRNA ligase C-terminal domain-containing protein [Bacillota bacterium]
YRQVLDVLEHRASREEMFDRTLFATRQLAKRQTTWLRSFPGVGVACGMERCVLAAQANAAGQEHQVGLDVFIVSLGDAARERAFELAYDMRRAGLAVDFDMIGRGLKAQMRYADKMKARFVAIIGDDELAAGEATVKDMSTGEQIRVAQAGLVTCMRRQ